MKTVFACFIGVVMLIGGCSYCLYLYKDEECRTNDSYLEALEKKHYEPRSVDDIIRLQRMQNMRAACHPYGLAE